MFTYGNKNWGKEPNPGELNQMIEIVSVQAEADEDGYAVTTDRSICKVWAQVVQSGDAIDQAAGAQAAAGSLNFVIRHREDIEVGMVILFDGGRYEIIALGGFDFKKRFLGMKATRTEVISA